MDEDEVRKALASITLSQLLDYRRDLVREIEHNVVPEIEHDLVRDIEQEYRERLDEARGEVHQRRGELSRALDRIELQERWLSRVQKGALVAQAAVRRERQRRLDRTKMMMIAITAGDPGLAIRIGHHSLHHPDDEDYPGEGSPVLGDQWWWYTNGGFSDPPTGRAGSWNYNEQ